MCPSVKLNGGFVVIYHMCTSWVRATRYELCANVKPAHLKFKRPQAKRSPTSLSEHVSHNAMHSSIERALSKPTCSSVTVLKLY